MGRGALRHRVRAALRLPNLKCCIGSCDAALDPGADRTDSGELRGAVFRIEAHVSDGSQMILTAHVHIWFSLRSVNPKRWD
jgi:hypothetical protein